MHDELLQILDSLRANVWLLFGLLAVAAYVFGVPLLTLFTFRSEAAPSFERVGEEQAFPEEVAHQFEIARANFARLGFEELETLYLPHQMDNVKVILRMFVNRAEQDAAMAVTMYGQVGEQWVLQTQYVEINAHYRDGTDVDTRNGKDVSAFPAPQRKIQTVAPWLGEIEDLYHAHQAICALVGRAKTKEFELDSIHGGDVVAYLTAGMVEEFEQARAAGYVRYVGTEPDAPRELAGDDDNPFKSPSTPEPTAQYVPTIKGAYLMTWNELWPFKSFIRARQYRRSRRLLEQAGVGA